MIRKVLFYILNLTWGLPLNIVGGIIALFLMSDEHDPKSYRGCACFEIGERWGGLNLGLVILCQRGASDSLKAHEFGHAVQNCIFGPIMLLLVVCSAVRYHYLNYLESNGKPVPPYNSWWFEGQATRLGNLHR